MPQSIPVNNITGSLGLSKNIGNVVRDVVNFGSHGICLPYIAGLNLQRVLLKVRMIAEP